MTTVKDTLQQGKKTMQNSENLIQRMSYKLKRLEEKSIK